MFTAVFPCFFLLIVTGVDGGKLDGKRLFVNYNCNLCHSALSGGVKAVTREKETPERKVVDVSGMATKHKADWLKRYLQKDEKLGDRKHPSRLKGSDAEIDVLLKWLLSLKPLKEEKVTP